MKPRSMVRLEDKLAAHEAHLFALGRKDRPAHLVAALVVAVTIHLALLFVPAPRAAVGPTPAPVRATFPTVVRWVPGPLDAAREATLPITTPAPVASPQGAPSVAPRGPAPAAPRAERDLYTRSEPVAEPLLPVAASLPREAETLIGTPTPPPPPPPPPPAGSAAFPVSTRPVPTPDGRVDPDFPPAARALRLSGSVLLEVEVAEDGTVGRVTVVRASRRGVGFEEAASAAVRRWRFIPGTHDGRPVTATTTVEVTFR